MTTMHAPTPGTIQTDRYGDSAAVLCGAAGSYYSTEPDRVNCPGCRMIARATSSTRTAA